MGDVIERLGALGGRAARLRPGLARADQHHQGQPRDQRGHAVLARPRLTDPPCVNSHVFTVPLEVLEGGVMFKVRTARALTLLRSRC